MPTLIPYSSVSTNDNTPLLDWYDVAEADRERMRAEYQKGMQELQSRLDQISTEVGEAFQKEDVIVTGSDDESDAEAAPETA